MNILFCTVPHGPPEKTGYDHGLVALAEGLEELNRSGADHRWSGTVPYWRRSESNDDWLIPADGRVHWNNADIVIVSYLLLGEGGRLPGELDTLRPETKTVFLDAMDGWRTFFLWPRMRQFDIVLRTHTSSRFRVPSNVRPWSFGLTQRILSSTDDQERPRETRAPQIAFNVRIGHPLRDWAAQRVIPRLSNRWTVNTQSDLAPPEGTQDRLYWAQTGRRHYPGYYQRLCTSAVGFAYGGYFAPGWPRSLNSPVLRLLYKGVNTLGLKTKTIVQFDSWRFWETLAAGALTIHLDLDRYGASFPVQPEKGVHYWAISPDRWERDTQELLDLDPRDLDRIARQGQAWARAHYSPRAQIQRLFEYLGLQE